ncbi:TPA: type-F conjugative transfer system protein TrbI [Klebsiella michiganensis]|nr:type-F conjugative transfer system protein TrbI [Klebsiella michiganensis]
MEEKAEQQPEKLQQQQPQKPVQQKDKATSRTFRRVLVITALVVFTLTCNVILTRVMLAHITPRVVAFDMKKTLDSFMDSVSQKQLTEAQSKALSDRFNDALEKSLADYQQQHHVVILVSPAVVQGAPDVTRNIQHDIARRMKGAQQ